MKSNSNIKPTILLDLGDGNFHYNYNIKEVEDSTGAEYEYDTAFISGVPDYDKIVLAVIRNSYDENEELNLINKYNANILGVANNDMTKYKEYLIFLSNIKEMIKQDLQNAPSLNNITE